MPRAVHDGVREVLEGDDVREILRETFFTSTPPEGMPRPALPPRPSAPPSASPEASKSRAVKRRPDHYKVICISMYIEDLERLDAAVAELKRRGYTKANRSAVLRAAMEQLDLDRVRKGI